MSEAQSLQSLCEKKDFDSVLSLVSDVNCVVNPWGQSVIFLYGEHCTSEDDWRCLLELFKHQIHFAQEDHRGNTPLLHTARANNPTGLNTFLETIVLQLSE